MKTCEHFPNLYFSGSNGIMGGIFVVIAFAILLFSIWSACCLLGGFLGAAGEIV